MVKCLECSTEFENDVILHRHLRSHSLRVSQYYQKHFPRYDKLTGELIEFKTKDFYFTHNFNIRENFKTWYKHQSNEVLKEYCRNFLIQHKETKGIYAPCQVELRTLQCPSILGFDRIFGDYYKLCYELGFRVTRERWKAVLPYSLGEREFIFVDTREQKPLNFIFPTKITTLDIGDYAFGTEQEYYNLYIERKSLTDFINSFGRDIERIRKEFARGAGKQILVLVEIDMKFALIFNSLPFVTERIQVKPEYIFHNVRHVLRDFQNVQFLFVKNRSEAVRVINFLFLQHGEIFKYDLQYAYDCGFL